MPGLFKQAWHRTLRTSVSAGMSLQHVVSGGQLLRLSPGDEGSRGVGGR